MGESWLFFGCRSASEDYLYGSELEGFKADGTLSHLKVWPPEACYVRS